MRKWDVVTFGEPLVNFVAEDIGLIHDVDRFTRSLGGAEANVAVGLGRLARKVLLITRLGRDILGDYALAVLEREGVDTSLVQFDEIAATGYQFKTRVQMGDPSLHYFRRGSAASRINWSQAFADAVREAAHLHLTGIPLALTEVARDVSARLLEVARMRGVTVSFDPNLRPVLWASRTEMVETVNRFALQADIVLPGVMEGQTLTGRETPQDIADFYLDRGVRLVVVKLGPEGAYLKSRKEEGVVAGYSVPQVVDTVGAGDGFAVGFIDGLLRGLPVREAVSQGCALGAMAVMSPGDHDGYPDRTALSSFLHTNTRGFSKC